MPPEQARYCAAAALARAADPTQVTPGKRHFDAVDTITDHALDVAAKHVSAVNEVSESKRLRAQFAAAALQGILADGQNYGLDHDDTAARISAVRYARQYADDMLLALGVGS